MYTDIFTYSAKEFRE